MSFDVSFPNTWKIPKKYVEEDKIIEQQPQVENERLFSIVTEITEIGIQKTHTNLRNIIKYNIEREEKDKLFETKVDELKKIFEKQNLEKLKGLFFEISEPTSKKVELEDDEEPIGTPTEMVGKGS